MPWLKELTSARTVALLHSTDMPITSSASIPLAMDVARRDGRIKSGDTVLLEGFGAGFTWGSMLMKMP